MKYGIFYIATSVYKEYFENFLKTVKYIFPDKQKELIVLSDGLYEYNDKQIENIHIIVENIIDYPYPLINLCKFQTIYYYANKYDIDKILYFDADTIVFEKDNIYWKWVDEELLSTDMLICSYHPHYLYNNEKIFYNNGFIYNDNNLGVYCDPQYIHDNKCYIMSSFFMGSIKAIEYAYKEIYNMSSKDLRNHRWIPWFSDEAYLNALYVKDNIINDKETIYLDKFITINPYNFNGVNFDNNDIWNNNFTNVDTILINQKFDINIKDKKRG